MNNEAYMRPFKGRSDQKQQPDGQGDPPKRQRPISAFVDPLDFLWHQTGCVTWDESVHTQSVLDLHPTGLCRKDLKQ